MNFADYPKDLQRIVELTPEGWEEGAKSVQFNIVPIWLNYDREHYPFPHHVFGPNQYNQCRAQWLAEKSEGDCNCDQLRDALEDILSGWRYIRETHGDLYGVGWDRAEDKARKALEQTK